MNLIRDYRSSLIFKQLRKILGVDISPYTDYTDSELLREKRPFAYFLVYSLPRLIELIPKHTVDKIEKMRERHVNKKLHSHSLVSTLAPGVYHSMSERMLHGLFDTFVDCVEIEFASTSVFWKDESWLKSWSIRRSEEAGMAFLKGQVDAHMFALNRRIVSPNSSAMERLTITQDQLRLYLWWKYIRPTREEQYNNIVGKISKTEDALIAKYGEEFAMLSSVMSKEESSILDDLYEQVENQVQNCDKEDTDMMLLLVSIHSSLWA